MSTRGFVWAYYASSDGNTYALQVDADYFAMPERGWTGPAAAGTPVYPRGWKPRVVIGLDPTGHVRRAVVASTTADLWTGAVTSFTIQASDETEVTCTVIKSYAERMSAKPH